MLVRSCLCPAPCSCRWRYSRFSPSDGALAEGSLRKVHPSDGVLEVERPPCDGALGVFRPPLDGASV